jgi:hypothetical protein
MTWLNAFGTCHSGAQRSYGNAANRSRLCARWISVMGAVWSYEVKRGDNSGQWHPHLHMIAWPRSNPARNDCRGVAPDQGIASSWTSAHRWRSCRGLHGGLQVRRSSAISRLPIHGTPFRRSRKRLLGSAGASEVSEVPEELNDEPLDDLPYVELFYRFLHGGLRPFSCKIAPSAA